MRVISGKSKGHKLKSPKGLTTRPTTDRIKESLFNILGDIHNEGIILDLFSGSGGMGIEFISRGAKRCYFIDNNLESIETIRENLKHTKLTEFGVVIKDDAFSALGFFLKRNIRFDYIFLDPPFSNHELLLNVISFIHSNRILTDTGTLIIEHESNFNLKEELFDFERTKFRKYGSETISIYKYTN